MAVIVPVVAMLDMVRYGNDEEFVHYFPKWAGLANSVRERFENFATTLEKILDDAKGMSARDFASTCLQFHKVCSV